MTYSSTLDNTTNPALVLASAVSHSFLIEFQPDIITYFSLGNHPSVASSIFICMVALRVQTKYNYQLIQDYDIIVPMVFKLVISSSETDTKLANLMT